MSSPSAYDNQRLRHINHLMDELNDSLSDIYENLVDRDITPLKASIKSMTSKLKEIETSIEDEL